MPSRTSLSILVALGACVWALALVGQGEVLDRAFFKPFSIVVSVIAALLVFWDTFLWRLPLLHPWPIRTPDLRGTWKGTIRSSFLDPSTDKEGPPIDAYMVIRQTYSTIRVCVHTRESSSVPILAHLTEVESVFHVWAVYRNEPEQDVRERSPIHYGAVRLRVRDPAPDTMDGPYWTNRSTKGQLSFERISPTAVSDFTSAAALTTRGRRTARR